MKGDPKVALLETRPDIRTREISAITWRSSSIQNLSTFIIILKLRGQANFSLPSYTEKYDPENKIHDLLHLHKPTSSGNLLLWKAPPHTILFPSTHTTHNLVHHVAGHLRQEKLAGGSGSLLCLSPHFLVVPQVTLLKSLTQPLRSTLISLDPSPLSPEWSLQHPESGSLSQNISSSILARASYPPIKHKHRSMVCPTTLCLIM